MPDDDHDKFDEEQFRMAVLIIAGLLVLVMIMAAFTLSHCSVPA